MRRLAAPLLALAMLLGGVAVAAPASAAPYWSHCNNPRTVVRHHLWQQACYRVYPHHPWASRWFWKAWHASGHPSRVDWYLPWRDTPYYLFV